MVYRIFVEKQPALANEARGLLSDIRTQLGIERLTGVRVFNRYDAENLTEELFRHAVDTVFSEPQLDIATEQLPAHGGIAFAVEYLPGQFDQRADSAAQCIQIMSCGERPTIRTARIYVLEGELTEADVAAIKSYVINPVESREATFELPETLTMAYEAPAAVKTVEGFTSLDRAGLSALVSSMGLAMDVDDAAFCQCYFREEGRDPSLTEIRMIDTYWSDHCRHTTFLTTIDRVTCEDDTVRAAYEEYLRVRRELGRDKRPQNLMDIGTIAAKYLKKNGLLDKLDESEEINACTVKMDVEIDGKSEPWLLLFKNETHNHPTEIEPFGGAATCIGGAIRDPLSGRSYVYAAMRVTGAADPTVPVSETIPGKLPQRTIVQTAAAGYSSYGNQIGLATGCVDELYHPGYAAKRMEIGAVIAAAPAENVRRERPSAGDAVILLGGRTGRDGIGGATGSSKAHNTQSVQTCGAEVQKGNAPEERKLQRLFRSPEACRMIKRCNDFGAGGVSVAIGELADGLVIDLGAVPKKYEGLDGTELAISESQERMAVVVEPKDVARFMELADAENLEATVVATVTEQPRLVMHWQGQTVVDISREFLNSNGAEKHIEIKAAGAALCPAKTVTDFRAAYLALLGDLNVCSKRGLSERFDSTIGAGTVLMPFGGKHQRTPLQAMVHKVSVEEKHTNTCSYMAWGYNPYLTASSPYHGAYLAVIESVSKLIAQGASFEDVYLTFQEYFEKPGKSSARWGKPFSALLGAFRAQLELGVAAIGGKDSMSGSFEQLDVPPTLVSFAVTTGNVDEVISGDLKAAGHKLVYLAPTYDAAGIPDTASLKALFATVTSLARAGKVYAAYTPTFGGIAEAVYKMAIGAGFGFRYENELSLTDLFACRYGAFLLEVDTDEVTDGVTVGYVTEEPAITREGVSIPMRELDEVYEGKLESVYPTLERGEPARTYRHHERYGQRVAPHLIYQRPKVLIPVFPGTNCEYDSAKVARDAGTDVEIFVINNLTSEGIARSTERFAEKLRESQIVFLPGGFSGGDEPDGSAKFIMSFFRNAAVKDGVHELLRRRDGLMLGICNGFQALVKLGLVPYGEIRDADPTAPTLTFNTIARHQSKLVRTRVLSNMSPWLAATKVGDIYTVPISHGEGRFLCEEPDVLRLLTNAQIATQYVDLDGNPTDDIRYNPNGSTFAIEGITSPDGRVLGKMGHSERIGYGLYKNVPGNYDMQLFASAVKYFKKS